jgi:hypothetical protein
LLGRNDARGEPVQICGLQCENIIKYGCHEATQCSFVQWSEEYGDSIFRLEQTLNIETARSFEMLVPIYQTT